MAHVDQSRRDVTLHVILASIIIILMSWLLAAKSYAQNSGSSSSIINAHVCSGGNRTPLGSITQPVNQTPTSQSTYEITATTSWVSSYQVFRGADIIASKNNLPHVANYESTVIVPLVKGTNDLRLVLIGGCPESTATSSIVSIVYAPESATIRPVITNSRSPKLTGRVSHTTAAVTVTINGKNYTAKNNGDGTWTLPEGVIAPDLADGRYNVRVIATVNGEVASDTTTPSAVTVDTKKPTGSLTTKELISRSPELTGTVSDPRASVTISINGKTYTAHNNGDGTWTLPEGVIDSLASGTYTATVTFTDQAGNVTTYTYQITIKALNEIGFLLAPNTGYLRVGQTNIPSWLLYVVMLYVIFLIARNRFDQKDKRSPSNAIVQ